MHNLHVKKSRHSQYLAEPLSSLSVGLTTRRLLLKLLSLQEKIYVIVIAFRPLCLVHNKSLAVVAPDGRTLDFSLSAYFSFG